MNLTNPNCQSEDHRMYQHYMYGVVYSIIFLPGLLGNLVALWVFWVYIKETKKAVVFMMNLAVADLLQVLSLPLRIYYYLKNTWPFGHQLCMVCFYLKYVNMYASVLFLVCVSVRRCELIMRPLRHNSSRKPGDIVVCAAIWLLVCLGCLPFPLLRNVEAAPDSAPVQVCFAELPMQELNKAAAWSLLVVAELLGFVLPFLVVLCCTCLTAGSLRKSASGAVPDQGEKQKALRMVLSCALVFLLCFAPYHITMPLDYLVKANALSSCGLRNFILRCHPVTLCLASLNCSLDPIIYYFTTNEFRKRLSKTEVAEGMNSCRRLSCITGQGASQG
ncbi:probable G-protein coupled receptor 174 [Synchiropus splendidus]|uniref:probable G-protein coupled receptor 174 n=1 Tax=Synchiropus splendidus TaxID=270530 RepID=UPI00237DA7FD|nr:probable G-protein coupled receptor 174 [Synchiropus splendidus]XP_053735126.1 probable G-protein coupled receptor 174 [Synchiropus splendidus]